MTDLQDRYRGVLLGKAVGDALGATLEFMSRERIRTEYGELREIIGGGWLNLPAGEITDDTQMAICIAGSIVGQGEFDPVDISKRFVEWYRSNPPDIGHTTRHALAQLANGVPWDEAGQNTHVAMRPRDASNGSVMRCAPVAMLDRMDPAANARNSADSSRITHANPLCVESCIVINAAIAALMNDPHVDPVSIAGAVTENETVLAALEGISKATAENLDAGGYVLATVQSALWAVTHHRTLEDAIVAAANLGEDADTTAAVAGALAGAKWGASAIPQRWLDVLLHREELESLADGIFTLSG